MVNFDPLAAEIG